jgi:tetratricopeptide (TPR) repeat protein
VGRSLRLLLPSPRKLAWPIFSALRWWRSLDLRLVLQALPAFVCGSACLAIFILCFLTQPHEVEAVYLDHAKSALKTKSYADALVCYERLAALCADREDILYETAVAAEAAGNLERAAGLMARLAPLDRQGYGKAHAWQALRLLSPGQQTASAPQAAETHLLRALEAGVEDREEIHALLGELYLSKRQLDQAEQHLLRAARTKPQVRLRLAHLYAFKGNRDQARSEANMVVKHFGNWAKSDLFAHQARLQWAEAVTFLEDFPGAVAILQEGWTGTGAPVYQRALAQVHVVWFDYLGRTPRPEPGERLAILQQGLHWDAKNTALLDRLLEATKLRRRGGISAAAVAKLAMEASDPLAYGVWMTAPALVANAATFSATAAAEADGARAILRTLLAKGQALAQVHFALGVDAWERGSVAEARLHWERANEIAPDIPTIANNLAWLLYQTSPADLPRALQMMNLAIAKAPNETNFRDTRGHIYAKMGKWREALADLEAALARSSDPANLHRTLAEVYEHLDVPALAAEHRRLARERSRAGPAP